MRDALQHRLDFLVAERQQALAREVGKIKADLAGKGALHSSGAMLMKEEAGRRYVDDGVLELAEAVERAKAVGTAETDRRELLQRAVQQLADGMKTYLMEAQYGARPQVLTQLEHRALSLVQQYWAGFLTHSSEQGSYVSIRVENSPGAAVQQGATNSSQSVSTSVDACGALANLEGLEREVAQADLGESADEMRADIEAIRLQLQKTNPSPTVLRELGKSLRNILEGSVAGVLSGPGLEYGRHLLAALGAG